MKEFENHPFRKMLTGVDSDVLWVLARSRQSRTASEIAKISGRSKSQVQKVLNQLFEIKLIDRTIFDGWSWNCLNDAHPFAHHLREMARTDFNLAEVDIPKAAGSPPWWTEE